MSNRRTFFAVIFAALFALVGYGLFRFESAIVTPALARAEAAMATASTGERSPPAGLREMIDVGYGDHFKYTLAHELLAADKGLLAGMDVAQRPLAELMLGLLLPLHLNRQQLETVYLARADMGPGVRGFEQAAAKYLSTDVAHLTRTDAAKLVAIAHAPIYFLADPLKLETKTNRLLSRED